MNEIVLLFPGQGSQYVGMGKKFESNPIVQNYFDLANRSLNQNLQELCWNGPAEELKLTQNTQPALVTYSTILFHLVRPLLEAKSYRISKVLGHSVGEYAALVAAGTLRFEDAVTAVRYRGQAMQAAVPVGKGKMFAVLRGTPEDVEAICQEASCGEEVVVPANFNSPEQIVISGEARACERAVELIKVRLESKRVRCVELEVSAPFHSPLMMPATQAMSAYLGQLNFQPNQIPYIANVDAREYPQGTSGDTIRQNLINQVHKSVFWLQSFSQLPNGTKCLEVGPGKVLKGLAKQINPAIEVIALDDFASMDEWAGVL